jgi:Tol biopolymer transport system component
VAGEKQLTFDTRGHQLTNINVWTADSRWLAYDVRPKGSDFSGLTIERVNISSGEIETLYCASQGAHVGVVTVSPDARPRYVFIHGPENPDASWKYDFHHRRGTLLDAEKSALPVTLDAFDITEPYTPGALRGGSHVHVFSPDGSRLSFTYNDHVMHEWDPAQDLRNVGVALANHPVRASKMHPREYDGSHFCVLVSQTTPQPQPGSDQINRAYEEGWIGTRGYVNANGQRQRWALAFIGDTLSAKGEKLPEVFVVDLPDNDEAYRVAGEHPLQGTATRLPAPPSGVMQRRLTFTADRPYPGVVSQPRHWLRASPDGSTLAFLMKDCRGIVQVWGVSPVGGEPWQISHAASDIQSAFSWHPQGKALALVCDNSVVLLDVASGEMHALTERTEVPPSGDAVVFSPDGKWVAFMREISGFNQIFITPV